MRSAILRVIGVLCLGLWPGALSVAFAQVQPDDAQSPVADAQPEDTVEAYLERLGLKRLHAEQLATRLAAAPRDKKAALAERLAKLYVELLTSASDSAERLLWEDRAKSLLESVPESDTQELRIGLARALYARAEEVAERGRLRLATPAELADAEKSLRALQGQLGELGRKINGRVELLQRMEEGGDQSPQLQQELTDGRRLRSLAYYFAGWSNYYLALLTKTDAPAAESLKCFGWLLGVPGNRPASIEKLPPGLLKFEHVSRAAIGAALASGLKGNDVEAIQWLSTVEAAEDVPVIVHEQILPRRIIVLAGSKRWADLEQVVRRARRSDRTGGGPNVKPLLPQTARLLAVLTLDADRKVAGPLIESLAKVALGDLVAQQQVTQVLDLVTLFGTAPIGDSGFIPVFVRGALAFEKARATHRESGTEAGDEPATDSAVVNQYRAAADLLDATLTQTDASQFPAELARAALMSGRARFFAGDFAKAAERFQKSWELGGGGGGGGAGGRPPSAQSEEALWLAVIALDRAAGLKTPADPALTKERDEASELFLRTYPSSERAPRIVLMQSQSGRLGDEEALRILGAVPRSSPVYDGARRQVVRILYQRYRSASASERDFAAARFLAAAQDTLAFDRAEAEPSTPGGKAAAERVAVRARQILDASLGLSVPDVDRAESALEMLRAVAAQHGLDLAPSRDELLYREVQIATARGRDEAAYAAADALAALPGAGGQFGAAAERQIYRRAAAGFDRALGADSARAVVRAGSRVIARFGSAPAPAALTDPGVLSLFATVARAADLLLRAGETTHLDLAVRTDRAIISAQPRNEAALRRLSVNAEAAGDPKLALECWRTLLAAAGVGSPEWFEARFNSIRLLAGLDASRARETLAQHRSLYPTLGPEPWGSKLRALDETLNPGANAQPGSGGGGPP